MLFSVTKLALFTATCYAATAPYCTTDAETTVPYGCTPGEYLSNGVYFSAYCDSNINSINLYDIYRVASAQDCVDTCALDTSCAAVSYDTNNECSFFTTGDGATYVQGSTLFIKDTNAGPCTDSTTTTVSTSKFTPLTTKRLFVTPRIRVSQSSETLLPTTTSESLNPPAPTTIATSTSEEQFSILSTQEMASPPLLTPIFVTALTTYTNGAETSSSTSTVIEDTTPPLLFTPIFVTAPLIEPEPTLAIISTTTTTTAQTTSAVSQVSVAIISTTTASTTTSRRASNCRPLVSSGAF